MACDIFVNLKHHSQYLSQIPLETVLLHILMIIPVMNAKYAVLRARPRKFRREWDLPHDDVVGVFYQGLSGQLSAGHYVGP